MGGLGGSLLDLFTFELKTVLVSEVVLGLHEKNLRGELDRVVLSLGS